MWHLLLVLMALNNGEIVREAHVVNAYKDYERCVEKSVDLTRELMRVMPEINNYVALCEYRGRRDGK